MKKNLSKMMAATLVAVMAMSGAAFADEAQASEVTGNHVVIKVASYSSEGNFMADQLLKVTNYVEEHSNGTIEFEYYLGATYCNMVEEFANLQDGSIDMCSLMEGAGQATAMLSLLQYARTADTVQYSVEVCNYLMNEDEETSPLILGQFNEMNIMPLGYSIAGLDAYCATSEITGFADMANLTFGCSRNQALFEGLGLNVISVEMQDVYESLSRGLVQATSSPVSNIAAQKYYEVAPYVVVAECGGATGIISMNLDKWNSLSESQQNLFREAYAYAAEWAAEEYESLLAADIADIEAGGGTVSYLSEEDNATLKEVSAQTQWNSCYPTAESQGLGEEFTLIFDKALEMVGGSYTK